MTRFEWFYHLKPNLSRYCERTTQGSEPKSKHHHPACVRRKIEQELNVKEEKPPIVNEQCVVYNSQCELCDAGYVGYTRRHLHNRVQGFITTLKPNLNVQSDNIRAKVFS